MKKRILIWLAFIIIIVWLYSHNDTKKNTDALWLEGYDAAELGVGAGAAIAAKKADDEVGDEEVDEKGKPNWIWPGIIIIGILWVVLTI